MRPAQRGGISDPARLLALAQFRECPFCYESHARVRTLACGGRTATRFHGAAPAQECRLRLKRLPPKALLGSLHLNPRPPERLSGLLPFRLFSRRGKRKLVLPFWKEKLRSGSSFSFQNGIQKIPGGKGRTGANTAQFRLCAMTTVKLKNKTNWI